MGMNHSVTREKILEALKEIWDPELKRDIVALGLVREIRVETGGAFVHLERTGGTQAAGENIKAEVRKKLEGLEGAREVTVQLSVVSGAGAGAKFASKAPLPGVRHVVAVASGKGGVGKSTVAVNLALALAKAGARVGLMDADIYGPNVPLMLGVDPKAKPRVNDKNKILPIEAWGIRMISMGVLVPAEKPMIWRGPMLHSAVKQFLQEVDWGELDFLLVDLPPGTGDVQLSLVQSVPLAGAVMVTTPQEVALMDVRKGIAMFQTTGVPILGIVENMTGEVFGRGGGEAAAREFKVPFLGDIPLDRPVRECGDLGKPIVLSAPDSPAAKAFLKAAELLQKKLSPEIAGTRR